MLEKVGVGDLTSLYGDVPAEFLRTQPYDLPSAKSEEEVLSIFEDLGKKNVPLKVFVGQGSYDHYTPSVIPYLTQRSEFLTAYTPYQAEISQGTLRYIFEYQSMICSLTGMDVSNASMYDGPTAAAEAMMMGLACTRKKTRVLLSRTLLPHVTAVVENYARFHGVAIGYVECEDGVSSIQSMKDELAVGDVAAVILPSVNRFGIIEDLEGFADAIHEAKALAVQYCDPSALAVLRSPAEWGMDVAVGDGQPLGIPLSWGGPYVGFMACRKDYVRKLPGRIVGQTTDKEGRRCFVLTLQAREQHIRREKATSNICSNESLMALWVTIYLSVMGPEGMRKVNTLSYGGAHCLKDKLLCTGLFEEAFPGKPFLKEFTLLSKVPSETLQKALLEGGFFAALPLGIKVGDKEMVSFTVTERRTGEEIDSLVEVIKNVKP